MWETLQELLFFAVSVILISASGVLSPGPLFASTIMYGLKKNTKAGIKIAHGHTIVELPLVILLGVGVFSIRYLPQFEDIISILGAIALFVFAGLQILNLRKNISLKLESKYGPILSGVIFSALNPFFLIWWITIGTKLISDALAIWSFTGIFVMFGLHIWMDYLWLGTVSFFASKSANIISTKNYKILMLSLSGIMLYFGVMFIFEVI